MQTYRVNYDYMEVFKIKIIEGRSFAYKFNDENNIIITESAKKFLGWENPLGKKLIVHGNTGIIVGVAKDFHLKHVFKKASPSIFFLKHKNSANYLFVSINRKIDKDIINVIEKKWKKILPDYPFASTIVNHEFEASLRESLKIIQIFKLISFTSIFIAGLGIFGLASFTSEQKTKEIGVRKILGASVMELLLMTFKNYSKLLVIANIIAIPIAFLLSKWFLEWAWVKKTEIGVLYFIIGICISFGMTFISVGYQSIKAVIANPVDALRNE